MIKVSVILTTYNSSSFIARTICSILDQKGAGDLFEMELIVVDDCSSDDTVQIIQSFGLSCLSTGVNSGGPNKGRNIGLKACTGDYICFIDHDDLWANEKILLQIKAVGSATVVTSGYCVHYMKQNKTIYFGENTGEIKLFGKNATFMQLLKGDRKGQTCYFSTLFIHASLKNILFEEIHGMLDFDHGLRLLENQVTAEVCVPLMERFVFESNLSLNETYRKNNYEYSVKTISEYRLKYPAEAKLGLKRINGTMARYYYLIGDMKKARSFFRKSSFNLVTLGYFLTTFAGSKIIRKKFRIFG